MTSTDGALRIDRWLFYCRFFKTRSLASKAVAAGHVKVNGVCAAPGNRVSEGDSVEILKDRLPYKLTATTLPHRRGPAPEAQSCYLEDADTVQSRDDLRQGLRADRLLLPRTEGRPDKHTQRLLRKRGREQ